ncbi:MAG: hemerythrin domain-containing protein [Casimicrobiaceae bacterium]
MSMFEKAKTYVGVYGDNDIRTKLQEDHKIFKELTKDACEGSTAASRVAAFKKLKPLLVAHARAEEAVVYTAMVKKRRSSPDSRDHGNEGFVEHSLVDSLITQISASRPAGADMWKARAKVLHELLKHHIDEEEKDVFEELGEHFDDEQREQMAADFEERRGALLGKNRAPRPSLARSSSRATTTRAALR